MAETLSQEQVAGYLDQTLKHMQEAFQRPNADSRMEQLKRMAEFFVPHREAINNLQSLLSHSQEARKTDTKTEALHHTIDAGFREKYKMQDAVAKELLTDMLFLRVVNAKDAITAGKTDVKAIVQGMLADAKIGEGDISGLTAQDVFSTILRTDLVKKSLPQEGDTRRVPGQAERKVA